MIYCLLYQLIAWNNNFSLTFCTDDCIPKRKIDISNCSNHYALQCNVNANQNKSTNHRKTTIKPILLWWTRRKTVKWVISIEMACSWHRLWEMFSFFAACNSSIKYALTSHGLAFITIEGCARAQSRKNVVLVQSFQTKWRHAQVAWLIRLNTWNR